MNKTIILTLGILAVILSGCSEDPEPDVVTPTDTKMYAEVLSISDTLKDGSICPDCICNPSICPSCEKTPENTLQTLLCANKTYLSFQNYQKMSVRIKWLQKRLDIFNNSDNITSLQTNLTNCLVSLNKTNHTLQQIYNLTNGGN